MVSLSHTPLPLAVNKTVVVPMSCLILGVLNGSVNGFIVNDFYLSNIILVINVAAHWCAVIAVYGRPLTPIPGLLTVDSDIW